MFSQAQRLKNLTPQTTPQRKASHIPAPSPDIRGCRPSCPPEAEFQGTFSHSQSKSSIEESQYQKVTTGVRCHDNSTPLFSNPCGKTLASNETERKLSALLVGRHSAHSKLYLLIFLDDQTQPKWQLLQAFLEQREPCALSTWDKDVSAGHLQHPHWASVIRP